MSVGSGCLWRITVGEVSGRCITVLTVIYPCSCLAHRLQCSLIVTDMSLTPRLCDLTRPASTTSGTHLGTQNLLAMSFLLPGLYPEHRTQGPPLPRNCCIYAFITPPLSLLLLLTLPPSSAPNSGIFANWS